MAVSIPRVGRKSASTGAKAWAAAQLVRRAATESGRETSRKTVVLLGGTASAVGGAAMYFFDPEQGARRRSVAMDRAGAVLRRGKREAARKADYAAGQAKGVAYEAAPTEPKPGLTDQELARKVESVIFRDAEVPKGQINVDAVGRKVTLRGEADPEMINRLMGETEAIPEVAEVENLLHAPGTPAPTRADTPAEQRRDSSSGSSTAGEATTTATAEQKTKAKSEPSPAEVAASGSGRQAAPVGSSDGEEKKRSGRKSKK